MKARLISLIGAASWMAFVVLCLSVFASSSRAYEMSGVGGKLGYTSPEGLDGTVTVGGHVEFQNDTRVHLVPNLNYWKVDRVSDVNPNMDVYYHFEPESRPSPYVGGGVGLDVRNSPDTDRSGTSMNANVIGGVRFPSGANHYFVETRFTASNESRVDLVGGITFKP